MVPCQYLRMNFKTLVCEKRANFEPPKTHKLNLLPFDKNTIEKQCA